MPDRPHLSVIIPVYNEERRIGATLEVVLAYLGRQDYDWEVVLVDDGSQDRTAAVLQPYLADRRVTLLANERNRGKGYSVRRGMLAARGRVALFTDADNSTPIEQVERLWPAFEAGADMVIGSRMLPESDVRVPQGWRRRLMGRVFHQLVKLLAVRGVADTQCGFKAFTRAAVETLFARQTVERWGFDPEILFIARRKGLKIVEIPVVWIDSTDSKIHSGRDSVAMLVELVSIRWNAARGRYR